MKQVLIRQGEAAVEELPAPMVEAGTLLVQVDHSCISIGTEMSGVRASGVPLWRKAIKPGNVKKVVDLMRQQGVAKTRSLVEGKLTAGVPSGYSAAGTVLEVGEGVTDIKVGDRVACAGAAYANHAEVVRVPRNLTVPVPDELGFPQASTVTLGAIAMQGVRRANPTLGETFVVIGLGILGQLTVQMLKANGCRVVGSDLDPRRVKRALAHGMDAAIDPDDPDSVAQVGRLSAGVGADGVIVTAAGASDEIISIAFNLCRRKGRVVLVGDVGLGIKREDIYQKELDFFISTSYGPGRYDRHYEEEGLDYPVSYVRWTENRNMQEYLRLLADGEINIDDLIDKVYPIDDAPAAYEELKSGADKPLMVLLGYPKRAEAVVRRIANPTAPAGGAGRVRLGIVGAGGFAKGMHLPNLQSLTELYHIRAIASRTGYNAQDTAKQFAAEYATTDYREVLADAMTDAVLIATRHNLHAEMVLEALEAGKHVLVEKPLSLTRDELDRVAAFYDGREDGPVLLTGFNRRFSPFARRIRELTAERSAPVMITYRMNAGYIPLDHWVHGPEGGGRNVGEGCHIYDLFTYLVDSPVVDVTARSISNAGGHYSPRDNFAMTATFEDGSVATLTYTALGSTEHPKEQMEVFCDGKVYLLDDYRELSIKGSSASGIKTTAFEKGQREEVIDFARAIREGGEWPIPLWQQAQAMRIAFDVEDQLSGAPECAE